MNRATPLPKHFPLNRKKYTQLKFQERNGNGRQKREYTKDGHKDEQRDAQKNRQKRQRTNSKRFSNKLHIVVKKKIKLVLLPSKGNK